MAKFHLDRVRKKYGYTGESLSELMQKIIAHNTEQIGKRVSEISRQNFTDDFKRIKNKAEAVVIPRVEDVLPKRSVFVRKAVKDGTIIRDTLKTALDKNLRDTLKEFTTKSGKLAFVRRAGAQAGTINPKVIKLFEQKITDTFSGYVKKDPAFGMPTNIHSIAVTELRTTINPLKNLYTQRLLDSNPDKLEALKEWIHNKSLSKESRPNHIKMNGKRVKFDDVFMVDRVQKIDGKYVIIGVTAMSTPHDPTAPADQIIGCNCDLKTVVKVKKKKAEKKA